PCAVELISDLSQMPKESTIATALERIFRVLPARNQAITLLKRRLRALAAPFDDRVDLFIDSLTLQKEVDQLNLRADQVSVLTMHAAKGLEFPVVFIIGCEENILPFSFGSLMSDPQEERRLLYVGMTRARRQLFLTHAKTRFLGGQRHQQYPSRFLAAISESLVRKQQGKKMVRKNEGQLKLF
ncbi:ATP-binding domain-containing protein, partial [candidate division KSB1 bacterium]|nr:ATP-binding domain-containing protein [candidate division KSB1 bacterium]